MISVGFFLRDWCYTSIEVSWRRAGPSLRCHGYYHAVVRLQCIQLCVCARAAGGKVTLMVAMETAFWVSFKKRTEVLWVFFIFVQLQLLSGRNTRTVFLLFGDRSDFWTALLILFWEPSFTRCSWCVDATEWTQTALQTLTLFWQYWFSRLSSKSEFRGFFSSKIFFCMYYYFFSISY